MSRNPFERNADNEIVELSSEPVVVMPEPPEGYTYHFIPRENGELAVYLAVRKD